MKIEDPRHPWQRLVVAARKVHDERDTAAPYGFATRVAALAYAQERKVASLFDRFALRAVGVSGLLALLSIALNYSAVTGPAAAPMASAETFIPPAHDVVAMVVDFAE